MIAREIHDDLGQSLTALKIDFSLLRKKLPPADKTVAEKAESIAGLIEATTQSVKRISSDLRPGILDHLGLTAAIEWQAGEFEKRTGISCTCVFEPEEIALDKDRTTTVFRVFQETLTNIARHAQATEVSVHLSVQTDGLMLHVEDNGVGISEKQIADPKSLGLIGIRERVNYWGGLLTIDGIRDKGTTITVWIPLDTRR
jgi:signal transduction histidine kinase